MPSNSTPRLDRRSALKLFATGAATAASTPIQAQEAPKSTAPQDPALPGPRLTATDPNLLEPAKNLWPLLLTRSELETASCLADMILPADEKSPSASAVGVPAFLNEWISAPYPDQVKDRELIRGGLSWLNTESFKRGGQDFYASSPQERQALCEEICHPVQAKPEYRFGAKFFDRFRDLCLTGFYTSQAGREDLGYQGNMPMPKFTGPPPAVLKHVGLI